MLISFELSMEEMFCVCAQTTVRLFAEEASCIHTRRQKPSAVQVRSSLVQAAGSGLMAGFQQTTCLDMY